MVYQLEKLTDKEKDVVFNAPALVTLLIAGADDHIEDIEIRRAIELVHIKTFSEKEGLKDLYKDIEYDFKNDLAKLLEILPATAAERNPVIANVLAELNVIFTKIDHKFAKNLYDSLKNFAYYISVASGSILSIPVQNHYEKELVSLPMLQDPIQ